MTGQAVVLLLALTGASVLADNSLTFVEYARNGRIVSGWEASEGQFPFQLSLRMVNTEGGVTACGGSIVHPQWAITAAHCTATRVSVVVRAGAVNLTRPYYIFETTEYYNHPDYIEILQSIVQPNDIGVIKFNRELVFNDRVSPIRVQRSADRNRNYDGLRLTASGWGRTWTDGSSPENLNWVFLSGTSNPECLASFSGSSIIQDSTVCARGYNDTTQSTCQGDSGGPLTVVDEDGQLTLVGVSSFVSSAGCHVDLPAGFCRPGHYHDWFLQVTGVDLDWDFEVPTTVEPETEESEDSESSESDSSSDSSESKESEESEESEEESAPESEESEEEPATESEESEEEPAPQPEPESESEESEESEEESVPLPEPETEENPESDESEENSVRLLKLKA